jgi:hypothetical protein
LGTVSLELSITNLASPPVLAFLLGLVAVLIRSDLRLPDALTQGLSIYLLLAIGLKGGVALRGESLATALGPIMLTIALGVVIPVLAFYALRWMTRLGPIDRGSIAAHYGSTSLVTFTAALVFLETSGIEYPGYSATLLTIMEVPGIIVGLLLANRGRAQSAGPGRGRSHTDTDTDTDTTLPTEGQARVGWLATVHEVVTGKSIVLLVGGLIIGFIVGDAGYAPVEPVFSDLFRGALTIFLLGLGLEAGRHFGSLRHAGLGLIAFALVFPLAAGALAVTAASAIGMGEGGAVVLGILAASASYIAAPAAVKFALPEANPAYSLATSIGVTFPLNLLVGIPLLATIAASLAA